MVIQLHTEWYSTGDSVWVLTMHTKPHGSNEDQRNLDMVPPWMIGSDHRFRPHEPMFRVLLSLRDVPRGSGSNRWHPRWIVSAAFAKRAHAQIVTRVVDDCGVPVLVDFRDLAGVTLQGHG